MKIWALNKILMKKIKTLKKALVEVFTDNVLDVDDDLDIDDMGIDDDLDIDNHMHEKDNLDTDNHGDNSKVLSTTLLSLVVSQNIVLSFEYRW